MSAMTESDAQPDEIQASTVPRGRRSVRLIEIDGQALIYDDEIRRWLVLNPTASAVWHCLDGSGTVAEIAGDVSEVFGAAPELVQKQVLQMVQAFAWQGMLEGVSPRVGSPAAEELGESGGDGSPASQTDGAQALFPVVPPST